MGRTRWAPVAGRRRAAAVLTTSLVVAMLAAAAPRADGSADSWGSVQSIDAGGRIRAIGTEIAADGRTVVEWSHVDQSGRCSVLFTRARELWDSAWGDPFSFAKQSLPPRASVVQAGNRVALVSQTCDHRLMVRRMHGTTWSRPVYLDIENDSSFDAAAINTRGDVVVTSLDYTRIYPAMLQAGSTTWTPLPAIPRQDQAYTEQALITDDGAITVVTRVPASRVMVETLVDGAWRHEDIHLPTGDGYSPLAVTSEPGGLLALVFHATEDFGRERGQILAYVRDRGADSFDEAVVLDHKPQPYAYVSAATSWRGDLVTTWSRSPRKHGGGVPVLASRSPEGTWDAPQVLGDGLLFGTPRVMRSEGGYTLVSSERRYAPDTLFLCDLVLMCSVIDSPPGVDDAYWRDYQIGPGDAVVAFGAGRDGEDYRYRNLRSTVNRAARLESGWLAAPA